MGYFDNFKQGKKATLLPGRKINTPLSPGPVPGDIGLELEVEGSNLPGEGTLASLRCAVTGATWTTHVDNSLRGGMEYVLTTPCAVGSVPDLVDGFFLNSARAEAKFKMSNRCSTHVHLNVSTWRVNTLTSFITLWSVLEPALIAWCGVERTTNHFCLGLKDTAETVLSWERFLASGSRDYFSQNLKYTALNVLPLFRFGSFEIRCGPAPSVEVIKWILFLHAFKTYVYDNCKNPADLPALVSERQATGILEDICHGTPVLEEFYGEVLEAMQDINPAGFETFREAQRLCYATDWCALLPEIDKEYIPNPFGQDKPKKTLVREPEGFNLAAFRDIERAIGGRAQATRPRLDPVWAMPAAGPRRTRNPAPFDDFPPATPEEPAGDDE